MMAGKIEEDLQCPVCMERFDKPRILPCGHSFCQACLKKCINKKARAAKSKGFPCIVCREPATPVEKDKPVSQWASLFPLNFSLASLASSVEDSETLKVKCNPCQKGGKISKANFFCIECQEYVCNACKGSHEGTRTSGDQKLVPCEADGFDPNAYLTFETKCPCNRESIFGKELTVYCKTHDQIYCYACAESKHGYCMQTFQIDKLNEEIENQNMKTKTTRSIEQLQEFCEEEIQVSKEKRDQLTLKKNDIVHSIKGTLKELTEIINRLDEKMTLNVTRATVKEIKAFNERTAALEKILSELSNISNKGKSSTFDFLTYHKLEKSFHKCEELYKEKADSPTACSFDYRISEKIEALKQELTTLGDLRVNRRTPDHKQNFPLPARLTLDTPPGITSTTKFINPRGLIVMKEPKVGLPSYWYPSPQKLRKRGGVEILFTSEIGDNGAIKGLDFCPDTFPSFWFGRRFVMVCDGFKENVRMYDTYGNCLCSCYIELAWGIAMVGEDRVAVCQFFKDQIQILAIETSGFWIRKITFKLSNVIKTNGSCRGITYHDSHIFAAINRETCKPSIQIMDLTGEVKEVIWLTTGSCSFVTIDFSNANTLYVRGMEGELYSVTRQGQVCSLHDKVSSRWNIATDNDGGVYTCDNGELGMGNCIVRMDPDGENVKIVMSQKESPGTPYQIWYNKTSNSFFVAHSLPQTRKRGLTECFCLSIIYAMHKCL